MVARGACIGYDEIRSMSGQYTSYWNAFLFVLFLTIFKIQDYYPLLDKVMSRNQ